MRFSTLAAVSAALFFVHTGNAQENASKRYDAEIAAITAKRPSAGETVRDMLVDKPPKPGERREGDYYVKFEERTYKAAAELKELVFHDNSDGFVFPGALLWTKPLSEGRFVPLPTIDPRPVVNSVFAGGTSATELPTFEHNGSFLDFQRKSHPFVTKLDRTAPRQDLQIEFGKNLGSALLNVGVSAKLWNTNISAGLSSNSSEQRSYAVLSLSEVYYTIVADTPGPDGYFPSKMLDTDPILADLILKKVKDYGEIAYVRSVKYGRRVLIAVSANATEDELRRSLNISTGGFGLEFKGNVDDQVRKVWESMDARAIVIGGKATGSLSDVVTGGPPKFLDGVNKYLKDTATFDERTGPVPVSFEVRYVVDNEPMINYETLEFSGQIVTKKCRAEETLRISKDVELTGADARLEHEDEEIDTDDWTKVDIRYGLALTSNQRAVDLTLTMTAYECEKDKRYNNETRIKTSKTIRLYELADSDKRTIGRVTAASNSDFKEEMFGGELHNWFGFPSFGAMRDISVHVDGGSGQDCKEQGLKAKIDFAVEINREQ